MRKEMSGSAFISRILCPRPFGLRRGHLSGDSSRSRLLLTQDATITRSYPSPRGDLRPGGPFLLFCLAPRGVCHASFITVGAVGSYPAFSPLPSVARRRFVFCDTFHCPGLPQNLQRLRAARCLAVSGLSSRPRPAEAGPTSDHSGRPAARLGEALAFPNGNFHPIEPWLMPCNMCWQGAFCLAHRTHETTLPLSCRSRPCFHRPSTASCGSPG